MVRLIGTVLDTTETPARERDLARTAPLLNEAQRVAYLGSWYWEAETGSGRMADDLQMRPMRRGRSVSGGCRGPGESGRDLGRTLDESIAFGACSTSVATSRVLQTWTSVERPTCKSPLASTSS